MIALVDYGVGNLFSLARSLKYIGCECVVTGDGDVVRKCERIILPGVGAFGDAADKLRISGLDSVLKAEAESGKPLLGICVGMQLLLEKGYEFGEHEGLGLIPGSIVPMQGVIPEGLKIPHIGWNALRFPKKSPLFANTPEGSYVYFVHSFYAGGCDESVIATTEYGAWLTAAVSMGNVCGVQFHPEKSGDVGLDILRAFCAM